MTPQEARQSIVRLNSILRRTNLDWVIQEVSGVVERGIEERRQVAFQSFDALENPIKKSGRKTEATLTRPLTEFEELRLLTDSIKSAIVEANEIQEKALVGLKTKEEDNPKISFRPDIPEGFEDKGYSIAVGKQGEAFDLSIESVLAQKEKIAGIKDFLIKMEGTIHAH